MVEAEDEAVLASQKATVTKAESNKAHVNKPLAYLGSFIQSLSLIFVAAKKTSW